MATPDFNLVPGSLNLNGVVGDDFSILLDFSTDLSGYTFDAKVLLDNNPYGRYQAITITNTNLSLGRITLSLSDTQTRVIGPISNKKWFISWSIGGDIRTVLSGGFTLNQPWAVTDYSPTTENQTVIIQTPTISIQVIGGAGGSILWGDIQGDIEDQTDLVNSLNAKANLEGGKVPTAELAAASTTQAGIIEIATDLEVQAGTGSLAVVVSSLAAWWTWVKTQAQTFAGNLTLNGTSNTAPNQTDATGAHLMTRDLTDIRNKTIPKGFVDRTLSSSAGKWVEVAICFSTSTPSGMFTLSFFSTVTNSYNAIQLVALPGAYGSTPQLFILASNGTNAYVATRVRSRINGGVSAIDVFIDASRECEVIAICNQSASFTIPDPLVKDPSISGWSVTELAICESTAISTNLNIRKVGDPTAPLDGATLFVKDNGSGKAQLGVKFPTGSVQIISTEP